MICSVLTVFSQETPKDSLQLSFPNQLFESEKQISIRVGVGIQKSIYTEIGLALHKCNYSDVGFFSNEDISKYYIPLQ